MIRPRPVQEPVSLRGRANDLSAPKGTHCDRNRTSRALSPQLLVPGPRLWHVWRRAGLHGAEHRHPRVPDRPGRLFGRYRAHVLPAERKLVAATALFCPRPRRQTGQKALHPPPGSHRSQPVPDPGPGPVAHPGPAALAGAPSLGDGHHWLLGGRRVGQRPLVRPAEQSDPATATRPADRRRTGLVGRPGICDRRRRRVDAQRQRPVLPGQLRPLVYLGFSRPHPFFRRRCPDRRKTRRIRLADAQLGPVYPPTMAPFAALSSPGSCSAWAVWPRPFT
jgi:hypothetical protein